MPDQFLQTTEHSAWPDARGRFGEFGGRFVPETLMHPVEELTEGFEAVRRDPAFQAEFNHLLRHFAGRPTPLYYARRLTAHLGGAQIYLKREDLLHTGAHKINNCIGQGLLAKRMGKTRVIAEKRAPASTASRRRPSRRCSASSARSTWAKRTWRARRRMSFA